MSNTNLHIDSTDSSPVSNAGTPVAGITNDFDNDTRDLTTPDIGADEFSHSLALNLTMFIEGFYNANSNLQVGDTLSVYLRNSSAPYASVDSARTAAGINGAAVLNFTNAAGGSYYIQLKHRNAIETWSSDTVALLRGLIRQTMIYLHHRHRLSEIT